MCVCAYVCNRIVWHVYMQCIQEEAKMKFEKRRGEGGQREGNRRKLDRIEGGVDLTKVLQWERPESQNVRHRMGVQCRP
jgi:hypothetical protein